MLQLVSYLGSQMDRWAHFLGGRPLRDQDAVLDLLFDPDKGLGLNIVRYNIGGGADLAVDSHLRDQPAAFLAVPGFRAAPTSDYDWSADMAQRAILFGAKKRGADLFEAFSNSPPPWMTYNGAVTGSNEFGIDNLKPDYYEAFADYLTEVVPRIPRPP